MQVWRWSSCCRRRARRLRYGRRGRRSGILFMDVAGLNERSAARAASSNCSSRLSLATLSPAASFRANSTYSILRLTDQLEGAFAATARKLLVLSASLSILALGLFVDAVSISMIFLLAFG